MATVEITEKNFKDTVETGGIVLLDWWATWCGPCRAFAPVFEKVAEKNPDLTFGKVNTEEQEALAARFGIQSIPTLMVFRDSVLVFARPGALPEAALDDLIKQTRVLDMDKVRKEIEEEAAKEKAKSPPNS